MTNLIIVTLRFVTGDANGNLVVWDVNVRIPFSNKMFFKQTRK